MAALAYRDGRVTTTPLVACLYMLDCLLEGLVLAGRQILLEPLDYAAISVKPKAMAVRAEGELYP